MDMFEHKFEEVVYASFAKAVQQISRVIPQVLHLPGQVDYDSPDREAGKESGK